MTDEKHFEYANTPQDLAQNYLQQPEIETTLDNYSRAHIFALAIRDRTLANSEFTSPDAQRAEFAKRLVDDFDVKLDSLAVFISQEEEAWTKHLLQKAAQTSLYPNQNNDIQLRALKRLEGADTPDSIKNGVREMNADEVANLILGNGKQINQIPSNELREIFAQRLVTETKFHIRELSDAISPVVHNQIIINGTLIARCGINALYDLHSSDGLGSASPLDKTKGIALADMTTLTSLAYKKPPSPPVGISPRASV